MAIGTALAIGLGSAVIGAGGSALAASKNSKAINKSTQANAQANAQSVALQRDIYGQNKQALSPFMERGNVAGNTMNALLGLGGSPAQPAQAAQPMQTGMQGFPTQQPAMGTPFNALGGEPEFNRIGWNTVPRGVPQAQGGNSFAPQAQQTQPQQAGVNPQEAANNAFDIFRGSTGYQFRLGEGMNALNSGYAGAGVLQSGDAMRAATEYGQNFASNEFGNYMGQLGNQQSVGLQGAGALAGVGVDHANSISALNMNNANNITNSAVARANNSNAMIGGIGNAFQNALGGFAYGGGAGGMGGGAAGFGMNLRGTGL